MIAVEAPPVAVPRLKVRRLDWFGPCVHAQVAVARAFNTAARIGKLEGLNATGVRKLRYLMRTAALCAKNEMMLTLQIAARRRQRT